jgi:alginate O-acetyltransferase complex protein AlgI
MIFSSFDFLYLLGCTFFLFYLPFLDKFQKYILITASFVFYGYSSPVIVYLLAVSILMNSTFSHLLLYKKSEKLRKIILTTGIVFNLLILCFYKYKSFFLSKDQMIFQSNNIDIDTLYRFALPIGISFYTFQGISLLVDSFKRNYRFEYKSSFIAHLMNISLYLSFFPQLIVGPIIKAHDFLHQIKIKKINDIDFNKVLTNLIFGYFLKMVIADNLAVHLNTFYFEIFEVTSSVDLLFYLISYSCYMFSDFAGYSYIAIGLGHLFGFKLPPNFDFPYAAKSLSEFWKKWHISLSQWLTEYLYIPLGGNRQGSVRTLINVVLTMTLSGLWHGATLGFALWGFYHGCVLVIERVIPISFPKTRLFNFFRVLRTYSIFTFLLLLFYFDDVDTVKEYLRSLFNNFHLPVNTYRLGEMSIYCLIVLLLHFFRRSISEKKELQVKKYSYLFYAILLFLIFSDHGPQYEFFYYRF